MLYQVTVPKGIKPGDRFRCSVNGTIHIVTCPPNVRPGQVVNIDVPAPNEQAHTPIAQGVPVSVSGSNNVNGPLTWYPQSNGQPGQISPSTNPISVFREVDNNSSHVGQLDATQFQTALYKLGYQRFHYSTCKLLLSMFDYDHTQLMNQQEYLNTINYVEQWQKCFQSYDMDRSGTISKSELKTAVNAFGYRFSDTFFNTLFANYDEDKTGSITFDEFIQLFCELHILTEAYKKKDVQRNGTAVFKYEEFLDACLSIHT